jgi:uncharacterized protein YkwD
MTPGQRWARLVSGAGLAGLGLITIGLAVAGAGAPAPASATSNAFLPMIYVPPRPTPTGTPLPVTPPAATDWQTVLQYYRASAHLPALAVNASWSSGAANHAHYMVSNDVLAYTEVAGTPWYSAAGATEAANSNLMLSDNVATTDQQALDFWMAKPFHALGLLDPALLTTGFGSFRHDDGQFDPYRMGAVVDVRQGVGLIPGSVGFPIKWPDQNTTVYLTRYDGNEQPDPLTSCPGYSAPSGLPILVQVGLGGSSITVGAHSIRQGNTELPHCTFTAATYTNALDPNLQSLGRQILAASDAIVLIPQQPLTPGLDYTVSIIVNDQTLAWTFHVAP